MEALRRIRTMRGMNQVDLAEASGVAQNTISEIELGKREARPGTLKKLAEALGVEIVDLLGGDPEHPLAEALPSQDKLFNGGVEERGAFIERCKRYVAARVAHYEKRLAEAERGGLFADFVGAKTLQDEAFEEFSQLLELQNGELLERWLIDPEVPEAVKEELGFDLVKVQRPFIQVVGRIGDRANELADTQAEKDEAGRRRDEIRQRTQRLERERRTA